MLSFDVADLQRHGVTITPLPDERGRLFDGSVLPPKLRSTAAEGRSRYVGSRSASSA